METGKEILQLLKQRFKVREIDLGKDAYLKKGLMHFHVQSYDIEDFGHFCIFDLNGMLGLMKMETVVLSCTHKDLPLLNLDFIDAAGKQTQLIEFYDTLENRNSFDQTEYLKIKDKDKQLSDYNSGEHWYDSLLMGCSYGKTGKKQSEHFKAIALEYFHQYLEQYERAKTCDHKEKTVRNRAFAQGLLDHGGPAVDQVRKMFGEEMTRKLLLRYMYGVES